VLRIDADGERHRREAAKCTRDVWVFDELDGHSTVSARMLTESAHALFAAVDVLARLSATEPDAGRSIGERRADALLELVVDGSAGGDPARRSSAHIDIVMGLDTFVGLGDEPAELRGSGPICAHAVRELLGDPAVAVSMRRMLTDPVSGAVIDVGRRCYEVPDRLRSLIQTRDQVCRFPGCRRKATRCQIDHAVAWDDGGGTDRSNLGSLCIRHHQLKTHARWQIVDSKPDGSCIWISPQGRRYVHEPERALP